MEPVTFQSDTLTVADIARIIRRKKWSLILPALLIFLTAAVIALVIPPVYRSSSTILIEDQRIPAEFVKATVRSYAEERIQMIEQRVMSYSNLSDLINRFNLYPDLRNSWTAEQIVNKMRDGIQVGDVSADMRDPRTGRATSATIAFTVSYEGKSPETVLLVANTLTSLFLSENQQIRERQTEETSDFLEVEMNRVKSELDALEAKIADFKETHMQELPEVLQTNLEGKDRTERDIERLTDQITNLKDREIFLQMQLSALSVDDGSEDQKRLEELKTQFLEMKSRFTEQHPDVIKTRKVIEELEKQLEEVKPPGQASPQSSPVPTESKNPALVTINSQLAVTRSEIEFLNRQIQSLNERAEQYRYRLESAPKVEKAYNALVLERDTIQVKYRDLMAKYMEAQVAQGLEKEHKGERFTLIEPAMLPQRPVKPNRKAILLIGFVLAVGSGIGFTAIREYTDRSVRDSRRLGQVTPYPVLASIPRIDTRDDITRRRLKRAAVTVSAVILITCGLYAFHNLVIGLDTLWNKVSIRLERLV